MSEAWPALCTFAFLGLLLVCIIRYQMNAFLALLVVSLGLGLAAGMAPLRVVEALSKGVGDILREVAILLALGSMLGRLLETSGAAEVIARTLVNSFGEKRASFALLVAGFLVGIPVLFNVAFLLLVPIMWRLQRQTGQSLLFFLLPLTFSLGITHSLIPPKPGIVGAVNVLGGSEPGKIMVQTIIFGTLLGIPMVLVGWLGPGLWWARNQFVPAPEPSALPQAEREEKPSTVSFGLAVLIVTLPLLLSLLGFGVKLLADLKHLPASFSQPLLAPTKPPSAQTVAQVVGLSTFPWSSLPAVPALQPESVPGWQKIFTHSPLNWLQFLGAPTMALLLPTLLAFYFLGVRQGLNAKKLEKLASDALVDVGGMVFLFGAAGGFKEVIQTTGAGDYIAQVMRNLPLPALASSYLVAVLMRIALGSATASILTASALLAQLSKTMPGQETLLVLAVACGVTFMTQPADSGFWMVKEFGNLSVRDVMVRFNSCRMIMSLTGLGILLLAQALLFP
jgi:H+/gluconate symporter-like permease